MLFRSIVIKDIPVDVSNIELCEEITVSNPELQPILCQHLKRRSFTEDKNEFVNLNSIKVHN